MKLPFLAIPGTPSASHGYIAVLASSLLSRPDIVAHLRTSTPPDGDTFVQVRHIVRESRQVITLELVDDTHHRCGEFMTLFVTPNDAKALQVPANGLQENVH